MTTVMLYVGCVGVVRRIRRKNGGYMDIENIKGMNERRNYMYVERVNEKYDENELYEIKVE